MSNVQTISRKKAPVKIDDKMYHLSYSFMKDSEQFEIDLLASDENNRPSKISAEFLLKSGLPLEISETLDIRMLQELCEIVRGQKKA